MATKKGTVANGVIVDPAPLLAATPSAPSAPNNGVDDDDGEDDVGMRDEPMLLIMMLGVLDGALDGT